MRLSLRSGVGRLAAAILLAGVALATTATGANAQSAPAKTVTPHAAVPGPIKNVFNGLCLKPADGSKAHFAAIVQKPCNSGDFSQVWSSVKVGTNHYTFVNLNSGLCMWAWDGAFNGGRVLLDDCNGSSDAEFNTNTTLAGDVALESRLHFRDTGFCLDVPGAQSTDGLAMQIYQCNGTVAQHFLVGFAF